MPGRILNFFEFSSKYSGSKGSSEFSDIENAASNFEQGFDQDTYDQPDLKPNRPVVPARPADIPAFKARKSLLIAGNAWFCANPFALPIHLLNIENALLYIILSP